MTHFSWTIDGSIVGLYLLATICAGVMVRKYVGKVEHFIVAGREVNVYLGIASLAATEFGVITCMYTAEQGYKYGFSGAVPGILLALSMFFVGVTGFCVKPLRQAGVMTIPELFEKRYGQFIRWAAGVVIVLGGLLNMGIFLRITGEFLVLVLGFKMGALQVPELAIGGLHVPAFQLGYLELMMTVLLLISTMYTVLGGMLSVLVTDFVQFIVMSLGLIAVTLLILMRIGWDQLATTVSQNYAEGGFNPFVNPDLGWQFVLFYGLLNLAVVLTWQTTISRLLAAKDAKTGQKIYTRTSFFFVCRFLIPGIWGIAALATFGAAGLRDVAPHLQEKASLYAMPLFLSQFVPIGLMGLLLAAMLAADMSTTASYMITWSSVIYNDVLSPFRKNKWSEKRGLRWNRSIVVLIGLFLLFYGLWYPLKEDAWTYLGITGTIYLASISTLLIACCYWKRANDWGAGAAIVVGAVIPIASLVVAHVRQDMSPRQTNLWHWYSGIAAYAAAGVAMVVGSLLKPKKPEVDAAEPPATAGGES